MTGTSLQGSEGCVGGSVGLWVGVRPCVCVRARARARARACVCMCVCVRARVPFRNVGLVVDPASVEGGSDGLWGGGGVEVAAVLPERVWARGRVCVCVT